MTAIKVGDIYKSNNYGDMEVLEYINCNRIKIKFLETGYERYASAGRIRKGAVKGTHSAKMEIGVEYKSKNYGSVIITSYTHCDRVGIRFTKTGYECFAKACHIRSGLVKDLMQPTVMGVGYLGVGEHPSSIDGAHTAAYISWNSMLTRAYSSSYHKRQPTYRDCSVCEQWHNFQNFAEWYTETYPSNEEGVVYQLDKDIRIRSNKVYSPETCKWVSHQENTEASHATLWKFIDPEGEYTEIYNLHKFCKGTILDYRSMAFVHSGSRSQYKGWTKYKGLVDESL